MPNFRSSSRLYIFYASRVARVASNIRHLDQSARVHIGGAPFSARPLIGRSGILFSFTEDDLCVTLDLMCTILNNALVPACRAVPTSNMVSNRAFAKGSFVISPSKYYAVFYRKRGPPMHHNTSVMRSLLCGASLHHEDGWITHAATIRQEGESQVSIIVLSTVKNPLRPTDLTRTKCP